MFWLIVRKVAPSPSLNVELDRFDFYVFPLRLLMLIIIAAYDVIFKFLWYVCECCNNKTVWFISITAPLVRNLAILQIIKVFGSTLSIKLGNYAICY